ncbi:hypothetical protein SAMN04487948_1473 [Halogranum amylolyticum]|uniref:Dolichyl-phosphate-mannose-protein mannosyltransferase n=1 Tax=Halogranum amylolyticum TaxID=660520 RepID=A0A1H8WXG3_9EURY|nr:hypothetical protein [Halogranum amylolyticum]SEP31768.1 hypothetical protein SAMN04487948_1473 [Halogranum amylolyticum]
MNERTKFIFTSICFLFAVATTLSVASPATNYELSIYGSTPLAVWIVLSLLSGISIIVIMFGRTQTNRRLGGTALVLVSLIIFALPLLRGYHFHGPGDSMGYRGISLEILKTGIGEVIYPALPTVAAITHQVTGVRLDKAWLIAFPWFAVLFVFGLVAAARRVGDNQNVVTLSLITAALFLPLNQISRAGVFSLPSTTTATIFLTPLALFLLIKLQSNDREIWAVSIIFLTGYIFFHPQQFVNYILVALTASIVYVYRSKSSFRYPGRLTILAIALFCVFWLWVSSFDLFASAIGGVVLRVLRGGTTGDLSSAGGSLGAVGGSLTELFIKLFFIPFIACVIVGTAMLLYILSQQFSLGRFELLGDLSKEETMLVSTLVPITAITGVYTLAFSQYFRHIGFAMVIVSVVLPAIVARPLSRTDLTKNRAMKIAGVVFLTVIVAMSAMTIHPSPFIFQESGHVTKAQVEGYEHVFKYTDESTEYAHLRLYPHRFYDSIYGDAAAKRRNIESSQTNVLYNFTKSVRNSSDSTYYIITDADRMQDFVMYDEAFLARSELSKMEQQTSCIYRNGGVEVCKNALNSTHS